MNKIDVANAPIRAGSHYPKPYDDPCRNKLRRRMGAAAGLKTLGINLLELEPGAEYAAPSINPARIRNPTQKLGSGQANASRMNSLTPLKNQPAAVQPRRHL
jgi:hypothetical protein